jgi:hypothetical protein
MTLGRSFHVIFCFYGAAFWLSARKQARSTAREACECVPPGHEATAARASSKRALMAA